MRRKKPISPALRETLDKEAQQIADFYQTELTDSEMDDIFRCQHGEVGWCSECAEEARRKR